MQDVNFRDRKEREAIHSGHFMVSHFEAEEQDDEDDVAVPVPETEVKNSLENIPDSFSIGSNENGKTNQQLSIETNLSKLFQCMSLAYRQKLTSPKWNRFRGIKLRWKDKIRLNNVIWRCWHMQFIMKQNTLICQFASPLDVDTHNKPEAIVLEGKYWKRKLQAVTAEYKKWRMFYRNQTLGCILKDPVMTQAERDALNWNSQSNDGLHMMVDEDYIDFMNDTLFSTISNQPFAFPDSREIARASLADFIQPSLEPLQPNLDDFMDTFEPLNEFLISKLPSVPEEQPSDAIYKNWNYPDLDSMAANNMQQVLPNSQLAPYQPMPADKITATLYNQEIILELPQGSYEMAQNTNIPTYSSVISKTSGSKATKQNTKVESQSQTSLFKSEIGYSNFPISTLNNSSLNSSSLSNSTLNNSGLNKEAVSNISRNLMQETQTRGYKFPAPVQPNVKFSEQAVSSDYLLNSRTHGQIIPVANAQENAHMKKDLEAELIKPPTGAVARNKAGHHRRSRSTSRDPNPPQQRPPLLTAVSDPAIINSGSSVLLTQLLTSNNRLRPNAAAVLSNSEKPHGTSSQLLVKREDGSGTPQPVAMLARPPPGTTLIITAPTQPTSGDQILLSSMSAAGGSPILDHSSRSQDSPESPLGDGSMCRSPGSKDTSPHREQRIKSHIHAEQKRRYNIKSGFDMLHSLIPHLNQNPNTKLSKAALLQKGADYIRQLRSERNQLKEEMDNLRQQIECLNTSISNCQSMLPITGAPVSRRRDNKMQEMFDDYVRSRTIENWKFWIFSLMIKPLLISYNNFVSTSSLDDLYRSTMHWVEQHCTLVDLRPVVLNSLRFLCTKTDILADPERLPEEAREAVMSAKPVYP